MPSTLDPALRTLEITPQRRLEIERSLRNSAQQIERRLRRRKLALQLRIFNLHVTELLFRSGAYLRSVLSQCLSSIAHRITPNHKG